MYSPTTYSLGVRCGATLYIAGQVPKDASGQLVGAGNIVVQAEQVFANLRAVLEAAGASLAEVVKYNIYTTDLAFKDSIAAVRTRYLDASCASTLVVVSSLADARFLVEIEAVAVLGAVRGRARRARAGGSR
jgi:enamine deaminase RidA (YjgF/YER057c/UK114 family)